MNKYFLAVLTCCFLMSQDMLAQRSCGNDIMRELIMARNPAMKDFFEQKAQQTRDALAQAASPSGQLMRTTSAVTIPVVFHIVLTGSQITALGGTAGIAERMTTQIETINRDFAGLNADSSAIPAAFKPFFGKSDIRFGAAGKKPDGSSTPGYEIITTTKSSFPITGGDSGSHDFFSDAKYVAHGAAAWDPTKYLNVWVINTGSGILGVALPPYFGYPAREIGICINYGAFGRRTNIFQYFISGIDKGRTLTHELGHFFSLSHIWGPGPGCGSDDNISDTPLQDDANYGNPTYPKTDACTPSGNGVMFMNYMDYVNDSSMIMFTKQQVTQMNMEVASGGSSYTLTQNPGLLLAIAGIETSGKPVLYPNPASRTLFINAGPASEKLNRLSIMNMMGQEVKSIALQEIRQGTATVDVSDLAKGIYLVQFGFEDHTLNEKIVIQ